MTRLIDANALKESIDEHVYLVNHGFNESEYGITQYGIHQIIDDAPTIDAEPVRHWKWIYGEHDIAMGDGYRCSNCGYFVPWDYSHKSIDYIEEYKYCPSCGARMDEE